MQVPDIVAIIAFATKGATSFDTVLTTSPTAMSFGWSFGRAQLEDLCHILRLSCQTSDERFTGMGTYINEQTGANCTNYASCCA